MMTPSNPYTIHVIEPHDVVPYIAAHRPSVGTRIGTYLAHAVTGVGPGVAQAVRLVAFVPAQFFRFFLRIIGMTVTGVVRAIRGIYRATVVTLVFVYITVPLFLLGVIGLALIMGFVYAFLDAAYLGYLHRHR